MTSTVQPYAPVFFPAKVMVVEVSVATKLCSLWVQFISALEFAPGKVYYQSENNIGGDRRIDKRVDR